MDAADHYIVISSDCHAGADLDTYRTYLSGGLRDEFDAWRSSFTTTWDDLRATDTPEYRRNFDSAVRQPHLEGDGIVGEVLYPNTVPPFAAWLGPRGGDQDPADARDLELRWAGLRAHNRWLADFCAELPGRRAGVAQIRLEDVDRAVEEIRWVSEQGLFGGILIPNPAPDSAVAQLHSPAYEPIWAECAARGLPVHTHGGAGAPDYGDFPASSTMMFLEFGWYAFRPLVRLTMSGVLERHPDLAFVMAEAGWMPEILRQLDFMTRLIRRGGAASVEQDWAGDSAGGMSLLPSEYWKRQCYLGASVMDRWICAHRQQIGLNTIMWGSDYPHTEGSHPHTRETQRHLFADLPPEDVALMLGRNALRAFRFDEAELRRAADRHGPTVTDIATPLTREEVPADATSLALSLG
jgi:predicted TIM-barrel fold metal-dependent hydrolase